MKERVLIMVVDSSSRASFNNKWLINFYGVLEQPLLNQITNNNPFILLFILSSLELFCQYVTVGIKAPRLFRLNILLTENRK